MVARLKRLDGTMCLGEKLVVRKLNEETSQTNAQASAIAIQALLDLQGNRFQKTTNTATKIKTPTVLSSRIVKFSNLTDREAFTFTDDEHDELQEDMERELADISGLERIKIVRLGEQRFGAEVGSVFVEFVDKEGAQVAAKKLDGRVYDGRKIKVCYIPETMYVKHLYI